MRLLKESVGEAEQISEFLLGRTDKLARRFLLTGHHSITALTYSMYVFARTMTVSSNSES